MNRIYRTTIFALIITSIVLSSCGIKDDKPPRLYLQGSQDTTVLLREKYNDPWFFAEDNVSKTENIMLESDIETVLGRYLTKIGEYTNRHDVYDITYTATDEAGNSRSIVRTLRVQNIATPYAGSYTCRRKQSTYWGDTTYRSTIIVDTRVAGRLRIGRVYNHWDPEFSNYIHFRVNADLWAPDLCRTNPHYDNANKNSGVGYQGVSNENNETPWFRGKSYEEATSERRFEYLMIPELTSPYTDSLGNAEYRIYGSNVNGIPLSKIEYLGNDISKITLHYNISRVGTNIVDQVIEEYTPLE